MPSCLYCREIKPASAFEKAEHVLPQSFGRFRDNLTLRGVVCDACNKYFGDNLELFLGRDSLDGFNRYRYGLKDPNEFKGVGRNASLIHHADGAMLKGALVRQTARDGQLFFQPVPQIGFGLSEKGPYRWYMVDALPGREELKSLVAEGFTHVHFLEVTDPQPVIAALKALGADCSDIHETRPAGWKGVERIESKGTMGHRFGRCITKIALNYLTYCYGAVFASMSQFDAARRYARFDEAPAERIWTADDAPIVAGLEEGVRPWGHVLTVGWQRETRTVLAQVSFHGTWRYQVRLSVGGFVVELPKGQGHFFNLKDNTVSPMTPAY